MEGIENFGLHSLSFTLIKSTYQCKGGDSKGWSKSITKEYKESYKCIFLNTERGEVNQPELLIKLDQKNSAPDTIYAKTVTKPIDNNCILKGERENIVEYDRLSKTRDVFFANDCWHINTFGLHFVSKNYPKFWQPKNASDILFMGGYEE